VKEISSSKLLLRFLFWESTIKCNLFCAHCRRLETNGVIGEDLSTLQAKDMIRQLSELGDKQFFKPVLIFSGGEPLCRGDLFEQVSYAKSLGIVTALATNGTLINSGIAGQIKDSGIIRVSVSLDGATAEIHNKLRQQKGAFEKAIEGIKHLREKEIAFQINVTLTRHNAEQLEEIYNLSMSLGAVAVHIFMLVPVGCGQVLAKTAMLTAEQYEQKLIEICRLDSRGQLQVKVTCGPHYERVIRQQGLYRQRKGKGKHGEQSRGCLAGLGVLFVSHKGDVFPCGYLPVNCGNIVEKKLADIWYNSEDLARMRDSGNLEGKCGSCDYKKICGGCRGRAFAATGNYMAQEPFCAYVPSDVLS
jgi:AdoMet-dependent heme synthase